MEPARPTDATLSDLGLFSMLALAVIAAVLLVLIVVALAAEARAARLGSGFDAALEAVLAAARADQLRRSAVLGTPTDEHPIVPTAMPVPPRGANVEADSHRRGRHRVGAHVNARPRSLAHATLAQAQAWLAVDRARRETQRREFADLLAA